MIKINTYLKKYLAIEESSPSVLTPIKDDSAIEAMKSRKSVIDFL
jgi:hypothetical protein